MTKTASKLVCPGEMKPLSTMALDHHVMQGRGEANRAIYDFAG